MILVKSEKVFKSREVMLFLWDFLVVPKIGVGGSIIEGCRHRLFNLPSKAALTEVGFYQRSRLCRRVHGILSARCFGAQ